MSGETWGPHIEVGEPHWSPVRKEVREVLRANAQLLSGWFHLGPLYFDGLRLLLKLKVSELTRMSKASTGTGQEARDTIFRGLAKVSPADIMPQGSPPPPHHGLTRTHSWGEHSLHAGHPPPRAVSPSGCSPGLVPGNSSKPFILWVFISSSVQWADVYLTHPTVYLRGHRKQPNVWK